MQTPAIQHINPLFRSHPENWKQIDRDYHLELVALSSAQMVQHQAAALKAQAITARANLQALESVHQRQSETENVLRQAAGSLQGIAGSIEKIDASLDALTQNTSEMSRGIGRLNETADASLAELQNISTFLEDGFAEVASRMHEQQKALESIAVAMRRPYEAQARETRDEAIKWLKSGAKNSGRDQEEDWKDALRLFRITIENPIGMQDYVAWFQYGWLLWKAENDIKGAEEAFYRAQRLSAQAKDAYHVKALRHLAHMHYLQDRLEDAYAAAARAMAVDQSPETLFDVARYAARTGRKAEAVRLLDRCIDLNPNTVVAMFAESDFQQ